MMLSDVIKYVLTPAGIAVVFYLGGVLGFLAYGMVLPRLDVITIKGLLLGSLMWPVILLYDIISESSQAIRSYAD